MKHKKLIISLTAVLSVIIILSIFLIVWFFGDTYKDFEDNFTKEVEIAGLKDGAVPQGLANTYQEYEKTDKDGNSVKATQQYFFTTAYMVDGSPSRIYVTGEDTGYIGWVTMVNTDGTPYLGHCGGIATNGSYLWVTGEGTVYVAKASEGYTNVAQEIIKKAGAESEKTVKFTSTFNANGGADFCYFYDSPDSSSYDRLYVGEFHKKGTDYETEENHRMTTPNGYENVALAYEYNVNSQEPYGLNVITDSIVEGENRVPRIQKIFSLPEKVQGFARIKNTLALSQSYGLSNSNVLTFDFNKTIANGNSETFTKITGFNFEYKGITTKNGGKFTDKNIRVYYADKNNEELLLNDYSIPSMSEGLCGSGNKVYVLFESAGKKYNKFVRQQTKHVYSFRVRN